MDLCPRCHRRYELCTCATAPATKGPAATPITGRVLFRAAVKMQRAGLPFATGAKRPDVEREFSTGKMDNRSDGYLAEYTTEERINLMAKGRVRERRRRNRNAQ